MDLWTYYIAFTSFALPILIGVWLGNRARLEVGGIIKGAMLGLVFLVAFFYITRLLLDLYLWKTYMPAKPATDALGQSWLIDPLIYAINTLVISYVFFLMAYFIRLFLRGRAANIAKEIEELQ